MVNFGLINYWAPQAKIRKWIVLSPVAPDSTLFFRGSETLIPEFLRRTASIYKPEGGKYHVAGVSNGGISTFRIAHNNPELVQSIMVLPGFPATEDELQNVGGLRSIPVAMFVGENDNTAWRERMTQTETLLEEAGGQVTFDIISDEGHVIHSLSGGEKLFELLESFR